MAARGLLHQGFPAPATGSEGPSVYSWCLDELEYLAGGTSEEQFFTPDFAICLRSFGRHCCCIHFTQAGWNRFPSM
jgi:hypothetical protein